MFVNDVFGLGRSNFLTGDVFGTQFGNPFATTPFGCNFTTGNITGQAYHPVYGYLVNRIPQSFFHQGVTPQVFGNVNTLGVNPLSHIGAQSFLPFYNNQFTSPVLAQGGFNGIGYGFSPYTAGNWNWTSPLGVQGLHGLQGISGLQSQICR